MGIPAMGNAIFSGRAAAPRRPVFLLLLLAALLGTGCGDGNSSGGGGLSFPVPTVGDSEKPFDFTAASGATMVQALPSVDEKVLVDSSDAIVLYTLIQKDMAPSLACPVREVNVGPDDTVYPDPVVFTERWEDAAGVPGCSLPVFVGSSIVGSMLPTGSVTRSVSGLRGIVTEPFVTPANVSVRGRYQEDTHIDFNGWMVRTVSSNWEDNLAQVTYDETRAATRGNSVFRRVFRARRGPSGWTDPAEATEVSLKAYELYRYWSTDVAGKVTAGETGKTITERGYYSRDVHVEFDRAVCGNGEPIGGTLRFFNTTGSVKYRYDLDYAGDPALCGFATVMWPDGSSQVMDVVPPL